MDKNLQELQDTSDRIKLYVSTGTYTTEGRSQASREEKIRQEKLTKKRIERFTLPNQKLAVENSFQANPSSFVHPTNPKLKAVSVTPLLPDPLTSGYGYQNIRHLELANGLAKDIRKIISQPEYEQSNAVADTPIELARTAVFVHDTNVPRNSHLGLYVKHNSIADTELGCTRSTKYQWLREYGQQPRKKFTRPGIVLRFADNQTYYTQYGSTVSLCKMALHDKDKASAQVLKNVTELPKHFTVRVRSNEEHASSNNNQESIQNSSGSEQVGADNNEDDDVDMDDLFGNIADLSDDDEPVPEVVKNEPETTVQEPAHVEEKHETESSVRLSSVAVSSKVDEPEGSMDVLEKIAQLRKENDNVAPTEASDASVKSTEMQIDTTPVDPFA